MSPLLKEFLGPSGLILGAAILGGIGAYWAAVQRTASAQESKQKSERIAELNERIAGLVTGGDSFCWLQISGVNPISNVGKLVAIHHGEFPIYDVAGRIVDLQELERKKGSITMQNLFVGDTNVRLGSMPVGTATILSDFPLGHEIARDFNIFFSARNGLYTQLLRMRKSEQKWVSATRVQMREGNDEKVVFEQIDPDFPKDQLQW